MTSVIFIVHQANDSKPKRIKEKYFIINGAAHTLYMYDRELRQFKLFKLKLFPTSSLCASL